MLIIEKRMECLSDEGDLLFHENKLWDRKVQCITGVDEVGCGPLVGPVAAAAVPFPKGTKIPFVDDSKKLTKKKREELHCAILAVDSVQCGIVELLEQEVDEMNILEATHVVRGRWFLELNAH